MNPSPQVAACAAQVLVLVIEPTAFIERRVFDGAMRRYLDALRAPPVVVGGHMISPRMTAADIVGDD